MPQTNEHHDRISEEKNIFEKATKKKIMKCQEKNVLTPFWSHLMMLFVSVKWSRFVQLRRIIIRAEQHRKKKMKNETNTKWRKKWVWWNLLQRRIIGEKVEKIQFDFRKIHLKTSKIQAKITQYWERDEQMVPRKKRNHFRLKKFSAF